MRHASAPILVLLVLVLVSTCTACSDANTSSTSGYNSECPNGFPYCLTTCYQCNAYTLDNFYCDCPSGQGCRRDTSQPTFSTCGTLPKYGAPCTQNSDCTTTYPTVELNINMPCVQGVCRYCDPVASAGVTRVCSQRSSQYPATKICISPGVWGVAGQSTSTGAVPASGTSSTGSTTTVTTSADAR